LNAVNDVNPVSAAFDAGYQIGSGKFVEGGAAAALLLVPVGGTGLRAAKAFVTEAEEGAVRSAGNTLETIVRRTLGADGASSAHLVERDATGKAVSITQRVVDQAGRILHQHQTHIGASGRPRQFPDEWVLFPEIR